MLKKPLYYKNPREAKLERAKQALYPPPALIYNTYEVAAMAFYEKFMKAMSPVIEKYHRLEVHGLENIPPAGEGFILAPNHSGWFGWDAVVVGSILKDRKVRWLSWSYEKEHPEWNRMVAAFDAILHNNERPFPYGEIVNGILKPGGIFGIFPEGNSNPMSKWYRLRPFFPGFIRVSAMAGAPIIPVSVSGLEEASPILWAKEEEREPIKHAVALPVVFPTKVIVRFGTPSMSGLDANGLQDREALRAAAEKIQIEVLRLLKNDRPEAYAENAAGKRIG